MQAGLLWEIINVFYVFAFQIIYNFYLLNSMKILAIEISFCKLYLCVFNVSVSFQMCKVVYLGLGGTKDQGNDLWNGSVAGGKDKMGAICYIRLSMDANKGDFVSILTYIGMKNHKTLTEQGTHKLE